MLFLQEETFGKTRRLVLSEEILFRMRVEKIKSFLSTSLFLFRQFAKMMETFNFKQAKKIILKY